MSIETQKTELRTRLKALEYQKSKVSQKIAQQLGVTGSYFTDDLDLEDSCVNPYDREKLMRLNSQIYIATWKLDELEYIDEPIRHKARQTVFDKIALLSLHDTLEFLHSYDCNSTLELVEQIVSHPELLQEMII